MSRYEEYRRPSRSTSTAQNNRQLRRYFCRGEVCQLPSLAGVGLWDSGKGGLARASAALGFALTGTPGLEESQSGFVRGAGVGLLRRQRCKTEYLGELRSRVRSSPSAYT